MRPILLELGSLPIRSYGLMMAISFIVGIWLARRRARARGLNPDLIIDMAFFVIILSILASRATYVAVHWEYFRLNPAAIVRIWDGGLTQYGGVVVGVLTGLIFFARRGVNPWLGADVVVPSLALGIAIGRWGCFLNGCCFGKVCTLPWAVSFGPDSLAASRFPGMSVHPTQIYSSLAAVVILFILLAVEKRKPFEGFLLWFFILLLASARFAIDPLRYYESLSIILDEPVRLSNNQLMSLVLMFVSVVVIVVLARRAPKPGPDRRAVVDRPSP